VGGCTPKGVTGLPGKFEAKLSLCSIANRQRRRKWGREAKFSQELLGEKSIKKGKKKTGGVFVQAKKRSDKKKGCEIPARRGGKKEKQLLEAWRAGGKKKGERREPTNVVNESNPDGEIVSPPEKSTAFGEKKRGCRKGGRTRETRLVGRQKGCGRRDVKSLGSTGL